MSGKTKIKTQVKMRKLISFLSHQVLDERVYHIEYAPDQPEPYYKATGKELQPRPVGEEHGIIVYNYMPISAVHYVSLKTQIASVDCIKVVYLYSNRSLRRIVEVQCQGY